MSKKRTITLKNDDFTTVWENGDDEVLVDVFEKQTNELILQWAYPKIPGYGGLVGQANLWFDQAVIQAKDELEPTT